MFIVERIEREHEFFDDRRGAGSAVRVFHYNGQKMLCGVVYTAGFFFLGLPNG